MAETFTFEEATAPEDQSTFSFEDAQPNTFSFEDAVGAPRSELRPATFLERLRMSPVGRTVLGETEEERANREALGGPDANVKPQDIADTAFKFTTPPPYAQEPIKKGLEAALPQLALAKNFGPKPVQGAVEGAENFAAQFPVGAAGAGLGENAGRLLLGVFAGQYAFGLPAQKQAFDQAVENKDWKAAAAIATEAGLNGTLLGAGAVGEGAELLGKLRGKSGPAAAPTAIPRTTPPAIPGTEAPLDLQPVGEAPASPARLRGQELLAEARSTGEAPARSQTTIEDLDQQLQGLRDQLLQNQIVPAEEQLETKDAGNVAPSLPPEQSVQPAPSGQEIVAEPAPEVKATDLTIPAEGEIAPLAAPETYTGGTGGPETLETPGPDTPAETAAPLTTESEPIPAEGAAALPPEESTGEQAAEPRSAAASRTRPISTEKRGWDIIDETEGSVGTIDPTLIQESNPDWKPVGAAKKIFRKGGVPADAAARALSESGIYKGDPNQVDQLGQALNQAALGRIGDRRSAAAENLQARQDAAFERDKSRPGPNQKPVVVDELQVGDTLKVRGAQFRVRSFEFDEDGRVVGVTLEDGKKYGTQILEGGEQVHVDKRSLRHGNEPVVTEQTSRGTNLTTLARPGEEGAVPEAPIKSWLDKAIEATDPLKGGRSLEGVTGAPVWLTKTAANGALKVVRAAYQAGKKLAEAIEAGVNWLRDQKGFDEEEARTWLTEAAKNANPVIERVPEQGEPGEPTSTQRLEAELVRHLDKLTELMNNARRRPGGLTNDEKSERYILNNELTGIRRLLLKEPEYVAKLIKKLDELQRDAENARKAGNGANAKLLTEQAMGIMDGELKQVSPVLFKQVFDELVAKGEITPSQSTPLPDGRTLGNLTQWLLAQDVDSPRLPLRERFNLAKSVSERWTKAQDTFGKMADGISGMWQAFKAQYKSPPLDTAFRALMKDWFYEKQWTGLETHQWLKAIRKQVPEKVKRIAISIWLDAGGDEPRIAKEASLVPERYRAWWQQALKLTESEKAIARRIKLDFEQKLDDSMNLGMLDQGREDYGVPQLWDKAPEFSGEYDPEQKRARNPAAKLDPGLPFFALRRNNPTYFDGIMNGGIPKSLDLADLVGVYNAEFHNHLADRAVIKALRDYKTDDGSPGVVIAGGVQVTPRPGELGARTYFVDANRRPDEATTKDGRLYQSVDHWALRNWKFVSQDTAGNPIIMQGDFLVHPDHVKFLRNELERPAPDRWWDKTLHWLVNKQAFLKASKFASATFHMATIGEHAVFHAVNPITRGVELDPIKNPKLGKLMRGGLELGFGSQRELFEEGLASHGGLWGKVPGLGEFLTKMSDWLFKDYIPKIKAKVGLEVLERNLKRYGGADRKLSDDQIYDLTASQVNAGFGMQNLRLLGRDRRFLEFNRLMFVAPDFLTSRLKVVAQALKPYGREQRYFLLAQTAGVYTTCRILNALLNDGDAHWEPENALRVIYHGRAYAGRFLVNDIEYALTDPVGFASGRLGVVPRFVYDMAAQRDMRTGARIEVPIKTNSKILRAGQIAVKDMATWLVPVGFEGFLPGAAGREQTGPGQLALGLVGVGSRRYTAENQVRNFAADFRRNSPEATVRLKQEQLDDEPIRQGAYRKLDDLLEAGELDQARAEYDELLKDHKPPAVLHHYNALVPFSGSRATESAFVKSLTPEQKKVYQQARTDRVELGKTFRQMLQKRRTETAELLAK